MDCCLLWHYKAKAVSIKVPQVQHISSLELIKPFIKPKSKFLLLWPIPKEQFIIKAVGLFQMSSHAWELRECWKALAWHKASFTPVLRKQPRKTYIREQSKEKILHILLHSTLFSGLFFQINLFFFFLSSNGFSF